MIAAGAGTVSRFVSENEQGQSDINVVSSTHVETVVSLLRKTPDAYVEIEVQTSELDLTPAEAEATYDEIKDYILEHHGIKVSSLNIAQTKRKLGLSVKESYNKPKSDDSIPPPCTPEREELIIEALRHYMMA